MKARQISFDLIDLNQHQMLFEQHMAISRHKARQKKRGARAHFRAAAIEAATMLRSGTHLKNVTIEQFRNWKGTA